MTYPALRRLVHALAALALLAVVAGWALTLDPVRAALPAAAVRGVASALLAVPLVIHLTFLLVQGVPGGRRIVPLRLLRSPDAWMLVFVATLFGPKEQLAAWAIPALRASESGVPLSLVTAALAIAGRAYQLNRGAALGVTREAEPLRR